MPLIEIIAGPTASGKSARALARALDARGAVINADALQVYDALPLLTAQPSPADRQQAPHALYGYLPPAETGSVMRWRDDALREIGAALEREQTPIVTGGTGFYIKALTEGLSPMPPAVPEIRARAQEIVDREGSAASLYGTLERHDPQTAQKLHPHNTQRVMRAWEVLVATGKALSHWHKEPPMPPPAGWRFAVTVLMPERAVLAERCRARFLAMMERGALAEVRALQEQIDAGAAPPQGGVTQALGFSALSAHLAGGLTLDEAVSQAQTQTWQYARRQMTWFRHQIRAGGAVDSVAFET